MILFENNQLFDRLQQEKLSNQLYVFFLYSAFGSLQQIPAPAFNLGSGEHPICILTYYKLAIYLIFLI